MIPIVRDPGRAAGGTRGTHRCITRVPGGPIDAQGARAPLLPPTPHGRARHYRVSVPQDRGIEPAHEAMLATIARVNERPRPFDLLAKARCICR
ncbi:hypothetical protein [Rhodosalinus sp. 5P4]|uniref:hypothetical protein n=1 Tax=Rhodosalinus sp. 5P4 TaxID=3239196 RepID=UPI003525AE34